MTPIERYNLQRNKMKPVSPLVIGGMAEYHNIHDNDPLDNWLLSRQQLYNNIDKEIEKEVEEKLQKAIDKALDDILKDFNK